MDKNNNGLNIGAVGMMGGAGGMHPVIMAMAASSVTGIDIMSEPEAKDDSNLTMLADYCDKTVATMGGDGYTEFVLYHNEETDEYELHYYYNYGGAPEIHRSYESSKDFADKILKLIDDKNIISWDENEGAGLCGRMYVVKFKKGSTTYRITSDNMPSPYDIAIFEEIGRAMAAGISQDKRTYKK